MKSDESEVTVSHMGSVHRLGHHAEQLDPLPGPTSDEVEDEEISVISNQTAAEAFLVADCAFCLKSKVFSLLQSRLPRFLVNDNLSWSHNSTLENARPMIGSTIDCH